MIRPAKLSEIEEILVITKACAAKMCSEGIYQWDDEYPSKNAFEKDIARNELFVLISDNSIGGCIVISTEKDSEYNDVNWLKADANNYYIHRLAIAPKFQHQGNAKKLMNFAESYIESNKGASVRLDTFSQNPRNQKFYLARGYVKTGEIYFPRQSDYPFYCYELILN